MTIFSTDVWYLLDFQKGESFFLPYLKDSIEQIRFEMIEFKYCLTFNDTSSFPTSHVVVSVRYPLTY